MSRALVWALVLGLSASWTSGKPALVDECGGRPADVVFILDVSSSIWPKHFREHVLTFVKEVVSSLHIGPGPEHTRVGAVTYSDRPQLEFYLNQYVDKAALLSRVSQIKSRGGNTNTHEALAFVDRNMFLPARGARSNVSRIVIVITDGASRMVQATLEAARALRNHGAAIFAIGVGSEVKVAELRGMASEPSQHFVFEVTNFQALANIKSELVIKTCKVTTLAPTTSTSSTPEPSTTTTTTEATSTTTTELTTTTEVTSTTTEPPTTTTTTTATTTTTTNTTEPITTTTATIVFDGEQGDMATADCINHPAEVYFVLDSSSSIWRVHFERDVLDFVRDMIDVLDIGSDLTRVGVITYSDVPTTVFGLSTYVHKDELMKAINKDNIRYNPGLTYTAEALQTARTNLLSEGRPGVRQIVILLTDGQSRDPAATQQVAQAARRDGVTLFAVGVGDGVDQQELHAVASRPSEDFVLTVDDFAGLAATRQLLAAKTCQAIAHASGSGSGNGTGSGSGEKEEPLPHSDQAAGQKCGLQRADLLVAYDWNTLGSVASTQLTSALYHLSTTLQLRGADVTVGTTTSSACLAPLSTSLSATAAFEKHARSLLRLKQSSMAAVLKSARLTGFSAQNGHRAAAAKKVLLVVLDAAATGHLPQVAAEAARLRSDDVEVFVLTSGVQESRLVEDAASEPKVQHVVRLPGLDFSNHAYVSSLLASALCGDLLLRM